MMMGQFLQVFVLIPFSILLSLSFFILVVLTNVKLKLLKIFGYLVILVIWITAFLIVYTVIYKPSMGSCQKMFMHQGMMDKNKAGLPEQPPMSQGPSSQDIQQK